MQSPLCFGRWPNGSPRWRRTSLRTAEFGATGWPPERITASLMKVHSGFARTQRWQSRARTTIGAWQLSAGRMGRTADEEESSADFEARAKAFIETKVSEFERTLIEGGHDREAIDAAVAKLRDRSDRYLAEAVEPLRASERELAAQLEKRRANSLWLNAPVFHSLH